MCEEKARSVRFRQLKVSGAGPERSGGDSAGFGVEGKGGPLYPLLPFIETKLAQTIIRAASAHEVVLASEAANIDGWSVPRLPSDAPNGRIITGRVRKARCL